MRPLISVFVAYLLGSIPFGYLIVRAAAGRDVRAAGSGGTGATNVSRSAGKAAGLLTLILDALKGVTAVLAGRMIFGLPLFDSEVVPVSQYHASWWVAATAVAVIIGHMFPLWLGFRGGKGVATGTGVFLILAPVAVAFAAIVFLLIVWRTRYVSLGSITAAVMVPIIILIQRQFAGPTPGGLPFLYAAAAIAILIVFAHRGNIQRLLNHKESKFY